MAIRGDVYTGGEHYWIRFSNGTHEVRRETPDFEPDNETVFRGRYEKCLEFLKNLVEENADYDLNL